MKKILGFIFWILSLPFFILACVLYYPKINKSFPQNFFCYVKEHALFGYENLVK